MLVFELKLLELLPIKALEQLVDVKHFKQLRLIFTLMTFNWYLPLWHLTDILPLKEKILAFELIQRLKNCWY